MSALRDEPGFHAVIMAGGSGTRFWPYSRRDLPKQFLPLGGDKSLLRQTYERLAPLATPARTWVITNERYCERVLDELPELSPDQVIGEPVGRNTAPCIGLAARRIASQAGGTSVLVCPADHVITPPETFCADVAQALGVLREHDSPAEPLTITFGIVPRYPATGFGYIERAGALGDTSSSEDTPGVYEVARFREKPDAPTAGEYLSSGRFYWNAGIFLWSVDGIQKLIQKHLPELDRGLTAIEEEASRRPLSEALQHGFGELPSVSIDYGVLEHTERVNVVAARFDWDDVGSWAALDRYAPQDDQGNGVLGKHLGIDTRDCLVFARSRMVATIGVEDLVIVETDDAVLVCRRDQAEKVKDIVAKLGDAGFAELA